MADESEVTKVLKIYGLLTFVGLLLPYIIGSTLVAIGVIGSVGVLEFSLDAHATRYFAGVVSLMLASGVYLLHTRYGLERLAIASLAAYLYIVLVPLLNLNGIQNPTRNITQLDIIIIVVLVTMIAFPVVVIYLIISGSSESIFSTSTESPEESDNQENRVVFRIVSLSTAKKYVIISVLLVLLFPLLFSSVSLVASNYHPYDEYNGGEIGCHIPNPTYQSNIQEEDIIRFSSMNEIDKKIFRMTINDSYLVSIRDDLSETEEYDLLVTKDRGYDKIVIHRGEVGGSTYFPPPDGLPSEPTMNITGSEYFSGGFEEKPNVRYQGENYWCLIDEFYVEDA